ncbi:MAG: rfbX 2 [Firmicutes bacterium]|nr:rfbX 2 [Bacillota bacterium]
MRVLGPEKFGLIAFAQAFIQYFVIITDYGFDLSTTREISINRNNEKKVQEIVSSVFIIKIILMFISLSVLCTVIFLVPQFRTEWPIYIFTFGMVLGNIMFPTWFFQGMENMKYITMLNIIAKGIFTILIFIIVRTSEDYIYVPGVTSLGWIIAGLISIWFMICRFKIRPCLPSKSVILDRFRESTQFFLSRVSVSIYTSSNAFVLGLFTSNQMVGYYSAAEKLYSALRSIYQPLNNVLYPYISKTKNILLYKKLFILASIANIVVCVGLFALANTFITIIYGNYMELTIQAFKIFVVITLFVVPSVLLGYPFLAALGYAKYANNSVIIGSVFHLIGLLILSAASLVNIFTVVWMVFVTEFIVLIGRVYSIYKKRLWA